MLDVTHGGIHAQKWTVLNALLNREPVSVQYGILHFNPPINSVTSRIAELRKYGFRIKTRINDSRNSRYRIYYIEESDREHAIALAKEMMERPRKPRANSTTGE